MYIRVCKKSLHFQIILFYLLMLFHEERFCNSIVLQACCRDRLEFDANNWYFTILLLQYFIGKFVRGSCYNLQF